MANAYNDPSFEIDTNCNVADLVVLKGGAIATTDWVFLFDEATLTVEQNLAIESFYFGDNVAGTAGTKTGHLVQDAATTITLHTAVLHEGLDGEGSTSTITLNGSDADNRAVIACNTADKVTNYNIRECKITATWSKLEGLYGIYSRVSHNITNTQFDDVLNGMFFYNPGSSGGGEIPESLNGCEFIGCNVAINDVSSSVPVHWDDFFVTNEIKLVGNANGSSYVRLNFGKSDANGLTRYMYCRLDADPMQAAPAWDTTTGIQSLADNGDQTLAASWNGATHGTGDTVRYRIYIRDGAAPDSFGVTSAYYLGETADTSFVTARDAAGNILDPGTTYYVIVRAATALSTEDVNTTSLNVTVAMGVLNRVDQISQTILSFILSGGA